MMISLHAKQIEKLVRQSSEELDKIFDVLMPTAAQEIINGNTRIITTVKEMNEKITGDKRGRFQVHQGGLALLRPDDDADST